MDFSSRLCTVFAFTLGCCLVFSNSFANVRDVNNNKKAAIVIDYTNGKRILFADRVDFKRHPASITKVMTIYLLFEAIKNKKISMNTRFKVSRLAANQIPSKLGLKVGQSISVSDIIKALIVKSANDVAVVAAEGLSGNVNRFCKLMNRKAIQLGMNNTHFENPSGVPNPKQISTARDLAKLGMAIYRHFPQYWHFFSSKKFTYKKVTHSTHCKIIHWCKGVDGAKTGYICASGFNLLVTAHRYNRAGEGKRLFVVVMGGDSSKARDIYASQLIDKYMGDYNIYPQKPVLKKAKKSLLDQVKDLEQSEPIIYEEEEVLVEQKKASSDFYSMLNELYKEDEELLQEEQAILIKPGKRNK